MTTGDEQQPPFDVVAAAEAYLQYDSAGESMPTVEDIAAEQAEAERQAPLIASLAEKGIQLDLAPGQTFLDKSITTTVQVEKLQEQWDNLAARQIAEGEQPGDEEQFDSLSAKMNNIQQQGERADMAAYIDELLGNPDPVNKAQQTESTITEIAACTHLSPTEKQAYLDVLEAAVGEKVFSEAMEHVRKDSVLEQTLGRVAAEETQATASAKEFQDIQSILIHDFGIANIGHEDWLSFTQKLHRIIELQRSDGPEAQTRLRIGHFRLQEVAGRLGIPSPKVAEIFTRFGIENPEA